jgi:hypothetical protein
MSVRSLLFCHLQRSCGMDDECFGVLKLLSPEIACDPAERQPGRRFLDSFSLSPRTACIIPALSSARNDRVLLKIGWPLISLAALLLHFLTGVLY